MMNREENFIRVKKITKEEWLKERGKGLGGSDIAALLGFNKNKTSIDLYNEKKGIVPKENIENEFTIYGTKCEPLLREMFLLDYPCFEVIHNENEILISKVKNYQRASLDGEIIVKQDTNIYSYYSMKFGEIAKNKVELKQGERGILEIKTAEIMSSTSKDDWHNKIPTNYYCQVIHYLLVTGYDFFILRVKLKSQLQSGCIVSEIRDYCLRRNDALEDIEYVNIQEKAFWEEHFLKDNPPSLMINL